MTDSLEIRVPDLGDFEDVEIIEVHVSAGHEVAVDDPLITMETDKAAMDLPAPVAGTIATLTVSVGDTVSEGDVIGSYAGAGEPAADDPGTKEQTDETAAEVSPEDSPPDEVAAAAESAEAPAPASSEQITVTVPDLGDFEDVDVIEVHVSAGDTVAVDDPLITLETDKAAMDVPAPAAGEIVSVGISVGDTVSMGDAIAELMSAGAASDQPAPVATPAPEPAEAPGTSQPQEAAPAPKASPPAKAPAARALPAIDEAGFSRAHASPSVRKLARELGVDLGQITGTGRKGRIVGDDVKAWVKSVLTGGAAAGPALPTVPDVDFAKFGPVEIKPLSRIQKISGPRLHASWVNLPHVTQHDEADITATEAMRQKMKKDAADAGVRLTPLAFVMRAVVLALEEFPAFKTSPTSDGKSLVFKQYCHLGFAADTPNGLVVPVIRDADTMSVLELAASLAELSEKARDGKLSAAEMQGGCFTVSSLGGIGGTAFTPIINAPEVAILGVSRSKMAPVWDGSEFAPRLILPLSLSYDHRVIDGAAGVRFTTHLAGLLADPDALMES